VVGYQRFGGPCCLHLQGEDISRRENLNCGNMKVSYCLACRLEELPSYTGFVFSNVLKPAVPGTYPIRRVNLLLLPSCRDKAIHHSASPRDIHSHPLHNLTDIGFRSNFSYILKFICLDLKSWVRDSESSASLC